MKLIPTLVLISICNYAIVVGTVGLLSMFQPAPTPVVPLTNPAAAPLVAPQSAPSEVTPDTSAAVNQEAPLPTSSPAPTTSSAPTDVPQAQPATSPGCLVQIKGVSYDLQAFRAIHEGGDIFQCNTDMTTIFSDEHPDSYLQQLEQYRL